jgi:hypothetical protein
MLPASRLDLHPQPRLIAAARIADLAVLTLTENIRWTSHRAKSKAADEASAPHGTE